MVAPMSKRRCGVGVAVLNALLYAVGGHDGQSYLNSIERWGRENCKKIKKGKVFYSPFYCLFARYDPQTNQWSADVAPTSSCRTSVGVAVLDGYLYAVGGQDGVSCLNHVERWALEFLQTYFECIVDESSPNAHWVKASLAQYLTICDWWFI